MHPRGSTRPCTAKSSCTIAHQPTENGEAEPQSIERNRSHSGEIANGSTTCRLVSQQSKNAPSVTLQSPSSPALLTAPPDASQTVVGADQRPPYTPLRQSQMRRRESNNGSRH